MSDKKKKVTLALINKTVQESDPALTPDDDYFKTATLLLAIASLGVELSRLAAFTKLPEGFIKPRIQRLTKNGIWKRGNLHVNWADEESGGIAFWMDVAVAEGLLARTRKAA